MTVLLIWLIAWCFLMGGTYLFSLDFGGNPIWFRSIIILFFLGWYLKVTLDVFKYLKKYGVK